MAATAAGGAKAPQDLQLTDGFHRAKRTSLLFSVSLLLTYLPNMGTAGGMLAPFAGVDLDVLRVLLAVGASYYFAGFCFEAHVNFRLNAEPLRLTQAASLNQLAHDLRTKIQESIDRFPADPLAALNDVRAEQARLAEAHQPLAELTARIDHELRPAAENDAQAVFVNFLRDAVEATRTDAERRWNSVGERANNTFNVMHEYLGTLLWLRQNLEEHVRRIGRFRADIFRARFVQFFAWELGGPLATFAVAIGMTLGLVSLADVLNLLFAPSAWEAWGRAWPWRWF